MDVPVKDPLTPDWFRNYAERHRRQLILATDEDVALKELSMKASGASPAIKIWSMDPDTNKPFIALIYVRLDHGAAVS